eukprot:gene23919-biopygen4373
MFPTWQVAVRKQSEWRRSRQHRPSKQCNFFRGLVMSSAPRDIPMLTNLGPAWRSWDEPASPTTTATCGRSRPGVMKRRNAAPDRHPWRRRKSQQHAAAVLVAALAQVRWAGASSAIGMGEWAFCALLPGAKPSLGTFYVIFG